MTIAIDSRLAEGGLDRQRLDRVAEAVLSDVEGGRIHGAAMRVSWRGETIVEVIEGYADKQTQRKLQRDSVFVTMSVAKVLTNVLALSLVERGLLRLHSPVADVIPEFARFGKEKINLYHLMTHTSGLTRGVPPVPPEVSTRIETLTDWVCSQPLESQPGEQVNYSMAVAHSVIAALCLKVDGRGRSFAAMLAEDLFMPLGMTETSLGFREDLVSRVCPLRVAQQVPYAGLDAVILEAMGQLILAPGTEVPAAGMLTTLDDLHRFTEMLRRGGELDGTRILSPATLDYCTRIFTGQMRNMVWDYALTARGWHPFPANLGIGFLIRGDDVRPGPFGTLNSARTFGGFGSGSTGIWVDPQHDLSYTFLSTGLLEDSQHLERTARLSDLVVASLHD